MRGLVNRISNSNSPDWAANYLIIRNYLSSGGFRPLHSKAKDTFLREYVIVMRVLWYEWTIAAAHTPCLKKRPASRNSETSSTLLH